MRFRLSRHARERCAEMGISTKEVKRAAKDGSALDFPSIKYPGNRLRLSGRLAIAYSPTNNHVITVLWRSRVPINRADGQPITTDVECQHG